jgi:uncharacterized protein (DUF2336 family)
MNRLTRADVDRLLNSPSPDVRADLAVRIAELWRDRDLAPNELRLADDIIRGMLKDVDAGVRLALAETLKTDPRLPHDVAMTLASDLDEIAVPMLNTSLVFSESDLIEVVRTRSEACQVAIASRAYVSPALADALIETRSETVAATLMRNEGAEIDEPTGAKVIDIFSGSELVMDAMAQRREVPVRLTERLVTIVAENLRRRLRRDRSLAPEQVDELVVWSRERALIDMLTWRAGDPELLELADQLLRRERLTPRLLLRALCVGKMRFFEAAMARLADIKLGNARGLVQDTGPHGLRSLCATTGMPELVYDIARFAVRVGFLQPHVDPEVRRRFRQAIGARFGQETVALDDEALLRCLGALRTGLTQEQEAPQLRLVRG